MQISIVGQLMECCENYNKDKTKKYYSLKIYADGQLIRVGVPEAIFNSYQGQENSIITLENVSLFSKDYSLYIKDIA